MKIFRYKSRGLLILLVAASVMLAVGLAMPMITMSKFIYIRSSFSVLTGVYELLKNGQIILFILVAGFSVLLPVVKIFFLFKIILNIKTSPENKADRVACSQTSVRRYLHLMHEYGRWAMLDVMVVAVLIVTVKLGAIATIKVHAGLYIFGASVVLLMFITNMVNKLVE